MHQTKNPFPLSPFFMASHDDLPPGGDPGTLLSVRTRHKATRPSLYKVFLLNDDFTPMDFVVQILQDFFGKSHEEATEIMLQVHVKGQGLCGVYSFEIAETKVALVRDAARAAQHPLQCKMEKA